MKGFFSFRAPGLGVQDLGLRVLNQNFFGMGSWEYQGCTQVSRCSNPA